MQQQERVREDEYRQLESARRDLVREFAGQVSDDQVGSRFDAVVTAFEDAPVRSFVPVLVRRRARMELRSLSLPQDAAQG